MKKPERLVNHCLFLYKVYHIFILHILISVYQYTCYFQQLYLVQKALQTSNLSNWLLFSATVQGRYSKENLCLGQVFVLFLFFQNILSSPHRLALFLKLYCLDLVFLVEIISIHFSHPSTLFRAQRSSPNYSSMRSFLTLCAFNFLCPKFPHRHVCTAYIDLFIGCFRHLHHMPTTGLIPSSFCLVPLPVCAPWLLRAFSCTDENNLSCATIGNLGGLDESPPECAKSPVPRSHIPSGFEGNAMCCLLVEKCGKTWERKWMVSINVMRVHGDFFGQSWFAQLRNITPSSPWRRWLSAHTHSPVHIPVTNARGNPMRKQRKWVWKPFVHWLTYPVCSDEWNLTEFPAGLLPWNWCFWLDIKESHLQRLSFGLIPRAESYHSIFEKKYCYKVFVCKCGSDLIYCKVWENWENPQNCPLKILLLSSCSERDKLCEADQEHGWWACTLMSFPRGIMEALRKPLSIHHKMGFWNLNTRLLRLSPSDCNIWYIEKK